MKKIISIILACVMVFSCMSVLAFADTIQYYRNDDFEFYIGEDGGAHIVYIHFSESSAEELNIPFRLCYDDEYMIGEPSFNGIEKDDNDAPDPFGSDYAYVTAVESEALNNYLTTLKKISFERYVSDIDIDSLRLEQLEEIVVDERNETFATSNGTLYSADKKKLILHPQGSSDNSILSSVTSFEKKAFADSTKITSITIPSGVTNIPERCFEGCTALESIDMSAAAIGKIGTFAFLNTALTSVTFGTGIKLIDDFAFFGNKNLTSVTIPQGATNVVLDDGVFIGCPIEELTVYRSIVEMGEKTIGFYYDEEFALQQYPDLVITTYKYDAQMQNTTPLYDYVKTNSIKFIPLDDIYCVNCNFNQMNGYDATMLMYSNSMKKYTINSSDGTFGVQNIPRAVYDVYFTSKFGLTIKVVTINMRTTDYKEAYNVTVIQYQPIGNVDGNNVIDIKDVSAMLQTGRYNSANADYDINLDGFVNVADLSIIMAAKNYGKQSVSLPTEGSTPIIPI